MTTYIIDKSVHAPSTFWVSTTDLHLCSRMCNFLKVHTFGKTRTFGNNYVLHNALCWLGEKQIAQKDSLD